MYKKNTIQLAEVILQLDQLRDELYEELMQAMGPSANDLLRLLQNNGTLREDACNGKAFADRDSTPEEVLYKKIAVL